MDIDKKEKYNVGIIVLARLNSSRLYQKVLQKINDRYALDVLFDHLNNPLYPVILAIPDTPENDVLERIALNRGIEVFRGFNESPLHRLTACAEKNGFDFVVRITTDDILIDSFLLLRQIKFAIRGDHDYVYMSRCPSGIAGEVIRTSILKNIIEELQDKSIEFISYEIKKRYQAMEYMPGFEYQFFARLTMDYEEDLQLIRILFSAMENPGTLDIINFLKKNPWCLQINHLPEVTIYSCNYNNASFVVDCMKSVLSQDFKDYEFIMLDDCSTDDSVNRINEFYSTLSLQQQKKIKVLRNEKNIGLPASCNKAIALARGKYIVRVDSDDRLHSDFLTNTIEAAKINHVSGVLSGYTEVDEQGDPLTRIDENRWHPACALFSRWVVNEIKYRDGIEFGEGKYFYEDFRKFYKYWFIPESLWDYRQHENQKTRKLR